MNILPGIKIIDLALYLEKQKTVIIGDLHLGYEEMLNKSMNSGQLPSRSGERF